MFLIGVPAISTERPRPFTERSIGRRHEDFVRARLAAIVTSAIDAIIGADLEGIITDWNPAAERLFGYTAAEAIGQSLAVLIPPEELPTAEAILAQVRHGSSVNEFETVYHTKTGQPLEVSLTVSPVRDHTGTLVAISAIIRQITERKRLEAELRASEARYRTLVEQIPAITYIEDLHADLTTTARYVSPQIESLLGYTPDEWLADPGTWDRVVHPEDRARVLTEDARAKATGEPFRAEYREIRRDGRELWVRDEAVLVRDGAGRPLYWQGVLFDISDRVAIEAALAESLAAAQATTRSKSQFLAMMSHELRTPLQAIFGYADFLLTGRGGPLTPDQTEDIGYIHAGATRLITLIDQMLELSRMEAGRLALTREPVDLADLLRRVRRDVVPQAASKGLALELEISSGLPVMMTDPGRLYQILLNLVGNAVKYTERGRISITACADGNAVIVAVSDTGIGIAPELLTIIFEEFHQGSGPTGRQMGGAGLGLAIAKRLAEQMGGAISVESTSGTGSTFTLRLPVTAGDGPSP